MSEVYLAGRGLASALGADMPSALAALQAGGTIPARVEVSPGLTCPLYAIDDPDPDWLARARRIVQRVAAESGALDGPREGPLFVASSSLDIGAVEQRGTFDGDFPTFAETIAGWLGWRGPVFTVSTACTSSLNALSSACTLIRQGHAQAALVLGLELRNLTSLGGFSSMQLLSPDAARPFGLARSGLVLGEAVAALHLGAAPSRWRIAGNANVVDGRDPAGFALHAIQAAWAQALTASALSPADIGVLKPQAAGSPGNDAIEAHALRQVFNPQPALVSFKNAMGHTLGASGAAEIALLTACLESGSWPKTAYAPDPALQTPLAPQPPRRTAHVLATILGFGGGHAAVVLDDCTQTGARLTPPAPPMAWHTLAHVHTAPPAPDWRAALAARLGQRPRRLGPWAELALHGALACLDQAGETHLPTGAHLRVASLSGPRTATLAITEQVRSGLPMPFTFLQSQPSQLLAALGQHLGWQGDARFTLCRDAAAALALAQMEAGPAGLLFGWVEEDLGTQWWRFVPQN